MKLDTVIIDGFRGYSERRQVPLSSLTGFLGENDVGKSTLLEALDAFFNDTAEPLDANTRGTGRFTVGCIFSDLPDTINLDAQRSTTLEDEYLLNSDGKLEIYKVWRTTRTQADVERIFARCRAPTADGATDLLFKKNEELKALVDHYGLESNKNRNPDMRHAIYEHFASEGSLDLAEREVDLDRPKDRGDQFAEPRKIWKKLNDRHLPVFSLFKAENVQGDKERTVRNPLHSTVQQAIKDLESEFSEIAEEIERRVQETTTRTLERLRQDYPELEGSLEPEYKPPKWESAFSLDVLKGAEDVPLNKRGAGVRRLVVLAFFQAEADKKRQDRREGQETPPVIYAIEEPETSQHPNFQRDIVQALQSLAEAGDQVILTTHVPGLAELLPTESIRYVDRPRQGATPRIRTGENDSNVLLEAARSLGVLPSALPSQGASIAIWVEGDTDVWVLDAIAQRLSEEGRLPTPLEPHKLYYVIGNSGDKLKAFVNGQYLDDLGLPQFYLRDSDKAGREEEGSSIPEEVAERVSRWRERGEGLPIDVRTTNKREIENYIHFDAVDRVCDADVNLASRVGNLDLDFDQISKRDQPVWRALQEAKESLGFRFPEAYRRGVPIKFTNPKHVLCGLVLPEMSLGELRERCSTTDREDQERSEVEEWFHVMADLLEAAKERR